MIKATTDILTMNKLWVEHSHDSAECCREDLLDNYSVDFLEKFEYLDVIGLFETSWMIYDHRPAADGAYGYPSDE